MRLDEFLKEMIEAKASDVFIVADLPIAYRVGGRQQRIDGPALMPQDTEAMVRAIYEVAGRSVERFLVLDNHDEDFSFALPGIGRFRANVFRQRGSLSAVIRVIPFGLPDPADFNIPEAVLRTAGLQKGLVLVTGPAGSGKSTTLACIIDRINRERSGHIITMEDPIEYIHSHRAASSPSARCPPTSPPTARRCARPCARLPTSSCWARCATPTPSAPP